MTLIDANPATALGPLAPETAVSPSRDSRLVRRLAASLAHNVNNSLTGVIGFLELGLRQCQAGTELENQLRASLSCAYQAADAVKRIVAFAFRATGIESLGPVCLREVAERVADQFRPWLPETVTLEVSGEAECWVWASDPLVRTAVEHLARNALEAMPCGGALRFHVEELPSRHCLTVHDTGDGMPPEVQAHLFEPFLTTKPTGHLGLGLVLSREMIEAQGGAIEVSSGPNQGTEVKISFPVLSVKPRSDEASPRCDERQADAAPHWANVRPMTRCAS